MTSGLRHCEERAARKQGVKKVGARVRARAMETCSSQWRTEVSGRSCGVLWGEVLGVELGGGEDEAGDEAEIKLSVKYGSGILWILSWLLFIRRGAASAYSMQTWEAAEKPNIITATRQSAERPPGQPVLILTE